MKKEPNKSDPRPSPEVVRLCEALRAYGNQAWDGHPNSSGFLIMEATIMRSDIEEMLGSKGVPLEGEVIAVLLRESRFHTELRHELAIRKANELYEALLRTEGNSAELVRRKLAKANAPERLKKMQASAKSESDLLWAREVFRVAELLGWRGVYGTFDLIEEHREGASSPTVPMVALHRENR